MMWSQNTKKLLHNQPDLTVLNTKQEDLEIPVTIKDAKFPT